LRCWLQKKSSIDGFNYDLSQRLARAPSADEYLVAAGLTLQQAKDRYGESALDWRPFATQTIVELMENLRMVVNSELEPRYRFHWRPFDLHSELVSHDTAPGAVERWLNELTARPSVIIIDGFSLYHLGIHEWLETLKDYATKENIVIVSLAPQEAPAAAQLYNALRFRGTAVFDRYFRPKIPPDSTFAHCRLNVEHVSDIARLIRSSLGRYHLEREKSVSDPIRKMGR
jgi:hypothetical protein